MYIVMMSACCQPEEVVTECELVDVYSNDVCLLAVSEVVAECELVDVYSNDVCLLSASEVLTEFELVDMCQSVHL